MAAIRAFPIEHEFVPRYHETMENIDSVLKSMRKYAGLAKRAIISDEECVNSIFDTLCRLDGACRDGVVQIWETVPEALQGHFEQSMRRAANPEFRWYPFYIGGAAPPKSDDECTREADLNTERLRAWAIEFVRIWDE